MTEPLGITLSPIHRTISALLPSGRTERFALAQTIDGDVFWRQDTFDADRWVAHGGRLSVGEVAARMPSCAPQVHAWTAEEIELGADLPGLDGFVRAVRGQALSRLGAELAAALPAAA